MAGFKRNTGSFGSSRTQGAGESQQSRPSSGRSSGGYQGRQSVGGTQGADSKGAFVRLASITLTKKDNGNVDVEDIVAALNEMGVTLTANVYLPKGAESITLRNKDRLMVSFKRSKFDKDFVVGNLSMPRDNQE